MLLPFVGATWKAIAPALANHLWQSTLFAAAAALLTLALRKNSARVRYAIWLMASLKFLVPFSLLVAAGSLFSWRHVQVSAASGMYVVEVVGQPFTKPLVAGGAAVPGQVGSAASTQLLLLLLCVWLAGCLAVLCVWIARWRQVSRVLRSSTPLAGGREYAILRRLQELHAATSSTKLMQSETTLEPGVFGIFRPVLLWPRSVSEHLDDAHLEAVIAHELCHVRRRDNLAAVLHMLVEAVFWFHPLVWWIGTQLIAERERACDEAVIQLGSHRHTYAESILKVCEFCLSSPLTCVSGVTGSDLKKRMVQIMTDRVVRKLNFARKLLLWTAACLAIALPVSLGLFNAAPSRAESPLAGTPKFQNVSIKPHVEASNGVMMTKMMMVMKPVKPGEFSGMDVIGVSLHWLIQTAYRIQETQLTGEPEWSKTTRYDIKATVDPSTAQQMAGLGENQRDLVGQQMLQQLLADYFKVTVHQESVELPIYELVVGDGGAKLQATGDMAMTRMSLGEIDTKGAPMTILTNQLSQRLGRTVVDKTGLTGKYAFTLRWTPDADEIARIRAAAPGLRDPGLEKQASSGPPLMTAIEEQLGLKLQPMTTRVPVLVIDHAEQPAQN
ncbi:MAG TPA: M56 family metallopeptidase [Terriglobales bacterium]|nr:M56 family metallopeptidase [Terriglobales bacterium]